MNCVRNSYQTGEVGRDFMGVAERQNTKTAHQLRWYQIRRR